jgi:hypothetical protein
MHKRHKICFPSLANHKGCLRLYWGAHKELGLSQPQTSSNDHQDLVWFSTIKTPRRRGQYKLFEVHHNLGDSRTTPSPSRGQVSKSNGHTKIIGEVLSLKIERALKRMAQISLRKLGSEWSLKERGLSSRNVGSMCFQNSGVANWVKEVWGSFYSPQKESFHWGVRDPDIFGLAVTPW